jgi:hypothetical protein
MIFPKNTFPLLMIIVFIFHCGLDVEHPTPPASPQWVEKSLPEEWPERGIDAHESRGIYLQWEPNSEEEIDAYIIYRAIGFDELDSLGEYSLLARLESESSFPTEMRDPNARVGTRYYYKLKAEDGTGNKSDFSEAASYMLMNEVALSGMYPNGKSTGLASDRELSWVYNYNNEIEDYIVTIVTDELELVYRAAFQPGNYTGSSGEEWTIPDSVLLTIGNVYLWRIDTGANYYEELEITGSESKWASFFYAG